MANIRILADQYKKAVKKAEQSLEEYDKSKKGPKVLSELKAAKFYKNYSDLEILYIQMVRKMIELRMRLKQKCNSGTVQASDLQHMIQFEYFVHRMHEENDALKERMEHKHAIFRVGDEFYMMF